ncbi:hypothetical protein [Streptomyces acidiscabies]|uniref:Uncharacterized protein n=1 Tax=Streptomyces acidiscabies TaxID=42234 RepID=A0A0L0KKW8_9ACTN|nr:hypothetical protein [Streptomyces acidiscabies]KND38478.1 hypothetical protein IQ63_07535 [Streptomyces acidiscabies]
MALVRLTIRPWETVDVDEAELLDLQRQGLIYTDDSILYANFYMYEGGPASDVTDLTITVSKSGTPLVGPTSDGISHIATGAYGWLWGEDDRDGAGDYLAAWDATDANDTAVHAEETVTLEED